MPSPRSFKASIAGVAASQFLNASLQNSLLNRTAVTERRITKAYREGLRGSGVVLVMIEDGNRVLSLQLLKVANERLSMSGHIHSLGLRSIAAFAYCARRFHSSAIGEHLRDATSVFDLTDVVLAAIAIDA